LNAANKAMEINASMEEWLSPLFCEEIRRINEENPA